MEKRRGFTLVELIVVIAVLAILAAILIPLVGGYIADAQAAVCLENRRTIHYTYQYVLIKHPDATLQEVLDGKYADYLPAREGGIYCPSGGSYSLEGEEIICSVHSGEGGDLTPPPSGGGAPKPGDIVIEGGGASAPLSGDWAGFKQQAVENWGANTTKGDLYWDETGYYAVIESMYLAQNHDPDLTLADYGQGLVKVDPQGKIYTADDLVTQGGTPVWPSDNPPKQGSLYAYNGKLYVLAYPSGIHTVTDPTGGSVWVLLNGQ